MWDKCGKKDKKNKKNFRKVSPIKLTVTAGSNCGRQRKKGKLKAFPFFSAWSKVR